MKIDKSSQKLGIKKIETTAEPTTMTLMLDLGFGQSSSNKQKTNSISINKTTSGNPTVVKIRSENLTNSQFHLRRQRRRDTRKL